MGNLMSREEQNIINELPEEIVAEILKRLQVKYILRCMCVQKSWYDLVRSPVFVALHLNYQKNTPCNPNHRYLCFNDYFEKEITVCFDDVRCENYGKFNYPPCSTSWRAQSHGLICLSFVFRPAILLWNPLVRKYKTLRATYCPSYIINTWEGLAFGFVPEVNDYVLVSIAKPCTRGEPDLHSVVISVYSLNTDSWRKICQDNVLFIPGADCDSVFVNRVAFWAGCHNQETDFEIIMCFDTKTDVLRQISFSDKPSFSDPILHLFGQSIAYFGDDNDSNINMWVLEGDPMNEYCWEKKMSFRCPVYDDNWFYSGLRNNGEPMLTQFTNLVSFNLNSDEPSVLVVDPREKGFPKNFHLYPFVESLVLLDNQTAEQMLTEDS